MHLTLHFCDLSSHARPFLPRSAVCSLRADEFMHMSIDDYPDEAVWEVFMALDDDDGGQISVDELTAFASGLDGVL